MGQKQAKLRQEVVDELVQQTAFSETEIQDWYKGFLKDCPTGHLTVEEFKGIYTKFFPYGEASHFAEYVFRTFDRNRDGVIDFREFLSTVSVTSRGDLDAKLHWAFRMYDLDDDGYISRQELHDVIGSIYAMIGSTIKLPEDETTPDRRSEKILKQMDTDSDGRISFTEFAEGVKSDRTLIRMLTMNVQSTNLSTPNDNGPPLDQDRSSPRPNKSKLPPTSGSREPVTDGSEKQNPKIVQPSLNNVVAS